MSFIYDTIINESQNTLDFFDWNRNDHLRKIKKIPVIKINKTDWINIYTHEVKITNLIGEYIITDSFNAIYINCTPNCKIKRSMLMIDKELEAVESAFKLNQSNIEYEIICPIQYSLKTRNEIENEQFIKDNIIKLISRNNPEEINFFLLDCNIPKSTNVNTIMDHIKHNFNAYNYALNFFKLINYSLNS